MRTQAQTQPVQVELSWGPDAIAALDGATYAAQTTVVVIDVLSFCTSVDIATARGATVFPWHTLGAKAEAEAEARNAELARGRRPTPESPWSLSPASLQTIPDGTRLVLPSPNGATLSRSAQQHVQAVVAGSIRNASAIADYLVDTAQRVLLVPAGEWDQPTAQGTWRTALEDWLGAGAIANALQTHGQRMRLSSDAQEAATRWRRTASSLHPYLQQCASGQELLGRDFAEDVFLAAQHNASTSVPLLGEGFTNVAATRVAS